MVYIDTRVCYKCKRTTDCAIFPTMSICYKCVPWVLEVHMEELKSACEQYESMESLNTELKNEVHMVEIDLSNTKVELKEERAKNGN